MEETLDYEKLADAVDAANPAYGGTPIPIDISEVFANRLETKTLKYSDLEAILEHVEFKRGPAAPEAVQQPRVQKEAVEKQRVPRKETHEEMVSAAQKLRGLAGKAGREFEETVERGVEKKKEEELVMPRLSLQDQLSDLEKIDEGLDEGVFSEEQTSVIVEEVNALSSISTREDISGFSEEQKEIALIRNAKIREIKDKLKIG